MIVTYVSDGFIITARLIVGNHFPEWVILSIKEML